MIKRIIMLLGGECVEIYSEVFDVLFSLHVPWSCVLLHILYFFFLYDDDDDVCSSPLSHMCCFFSLFIHMFLNLYNLSLFHT